jgi:O-Antigen ligase
MNSDSSETRAKIFSILLALVLVAGICLAWSPGFWAIFSAQAGVLLITMCWVVSEKRIHPSPELIIVALVSFWGVFQILAGRTISPWSTARASLTWLSAGMSFFVASQVLRRRRNRDLFLSIFLYASTALAFIAIVQLYVDPGRVFWIFPAQPGSVGTFLYKNQFAALLELAAPVALWRALSSPKTRYAGAVAYMVLFAAGVASVSRAGVILLVGELVFALLFASLSKRLSWQKCVGVLALAALILVAGAAIGGPQALWDHFQEKDPYGLRLDLLQTTLHMAGDRPWLGFGMGTFPLTYPQYARFDLGVVVNAAHSDWAEWATEGGFPFVALIAALLLMVSGRAVRSVWGIGVLAVALHSLIDYPTREPTIALTCFAIIGALTGAFQPSKSRQLVLRQTVTADSRIRITIKTNI